MAVGTTNRITLRIGVVFDKTGLDAQAKNVQKDLDGKLADSTKQQTKALKDQQKVLTKRTSEMKKEKTVLQELNSGWGRMVANFLKFTVIATISMAVTVSLKQMRDLVFELDTAMTNLSIVTGASAAELAMVDAQATKLTTSLGALKGEVINSVTEFARAGFDLSDALLLTERATMAANVGFTELDRITTFLIAGLKSFKLEAEDSVRVLDVLFRVANVTAIDLEGIGEAFLRSANTLKVAGATLEESASLIAAANESIQDPAKVGTALKTIASRLRGIGDEGEAIPTLARDFEAVGVSIQNADGSFRNIYEVFEEFAEVYKTLDDITKESLLEKLAGKRQKNIMIGLLENFDVAQMALEEAMNSAGAVAIANEKYLESLEGRTKILTETFNEFLRSIGDSDGFKILISSLTGVLELMTFITKKIPILITGITALGVAMGIFTGIGAPIAFIVGSFFALKQGADMFGNSFEKANLKLDETANKLEDIKNKIAEIKTIDVGDRTDSQNALLKGLERELEIEKELYNIRSKDVAIESIKELSRTNRDLGHTIANLNSDLERFNGELESDYIDIYKEQLLDLEIEYLKFITVQENLMKNVIVGGEAWNLADNAIKEANVALQKIYDTYPKVGIVVNNTTNEINSQTDALTDHEKALYDVDRMVGNVSKKYQILSDAYMELTKEGYLTNDMLNDLIETFPDIITMTDLSASAVYDYMIQYRDAELSIGKSNRSILESTITTAQGIIEANNSKIQSTRNWAKENARSLGFTLSLDSWEKENQEAMLSIQNAKNQLALLTQEERRIASVDKRRIDSLKKADGLASRVIAEKEALTELERKLRDVTQSISLLQKEYARTDDVQEQLKINEQLITQYKVQKSTLEALRAEFVRKNQSINKSKAEYDDYIDQLYKFDLQIEDTINSMFNLTRANDVMRKEMSKSVIELRDLMTRMIEQELKDEIAKYKDLISLAKEQLDIKLKQLDAEKDLADFSKTRLQRERDLSKIVSKMDSLRAAAAQGDMKAINELNKLEEERINAQESIDTLINDRSFDLRKENLRNQFDEFEATQQKEIDTLERNLRDASFLLKRANDYMTDYLSGNMSTLYQSLIDWNSVYGTGIESDVISKWEKAIELIKNFNALSAQGGSGFNFESYGAQSSYKDTVTAAMRKNSDLWHSADAETRKALNEKNIALAKTIGYSFNRRDGKYYSDTDGSMLVYDNGGFKPKGVQGYMAEGVEEWVLKDGQIQAMQEMAIDSMLNRIGLRSPSLEGASVGGNNVNVNIYGDITDNNVNRIERNLNDVVREVSKGQMDAFKSRGYVPNVKIR